MDRCRFFGWLGRGTKTGGSVRRPRQHTPLQLESLEARCVPASFRWASSTDTIYVVGPGYATLTDIQSRLSHAPLQLVDPADHVWLLEANLRLQDGATLLLHGSGLGGDVDQLRLKSNNDAEPFNAVWIRADWGTIDVRRTTITSWDETVGAPDTEYSTYPRAYIDARSTLDADGVTIHESRMDIADSDIGYLGYQADEAYGLVWKAVGLGPELHARLHVYGNVTNSRLHDNYFGAYTYGALGMQWLNNEIDHGVRYGLDLHDDSDYFDIEGNQFHDNGTKGLIGAERCDHLLIRNNVARDNGEHGIMLYHQCNNNTVEDNQTFGNGQAGMELFESGGNTVVDNQILENSDSGINVSVGSVDNTFSGNNIGFNGGYGVAIFKGNNVPLSGDGRPRGNDLVGNVIHDNALGAIRLQDADDNLFHGNTFSGTASSWLLERGLGNQLSDNAIPDDAVVTTTGSAAGAGTTYIANQPSVLVAVDSYSAITFDDAVDRVFRVQAPGVATTITPAGSSLTLTRAQLGTQPSLVVTQNLKAAIEDGSLQVEVTAWDTSGDQRKEWVARAASVGMNVTYTVGDLDADTPYTVVKDGMAVAVLTSDAEGTIGFNDSADTLDPVTYTVELASTRPATAIPGLKEQDHQVIRSIRHATINDMLLDKWLLMAGRDAAPDKHPSGAAS